ncbi:MAG: hypothetical protein P8Z37_18320, partial [Acidobacteriota bacterium]
MAVEILVFRCRLLLCLLRGFFNPFTGIKKFHEDCTQKDEQQTANDFSGEVLSSEKYEDEDP